VIAVMLLSTCNRPIKLLEKGHSEKALKVSLKRLKSGKIKPDHLYVLEKSFLLETEKDAQKVAALRQKGEPALWLDIHKIALGMIKRQSKVSAVQNRLNNKGHFPNMDFYPANALLKEAKENVALYYYAKAQELIPAAYNDDRLAARKAFQWLEKSQEYKADLKDSELLSNEMYAIGTTHVLLHPIEGSNRYDKQLFKHFFNRQTYPNRNNWDVLHLTPPSNEDLDYRIDLNWSKVYVSWDDTSESCCSNSEEVQVGCVEVKVWSQKDSAYVVETRPVFETVSVTVNSFYQSKDAQLKLSCDLYNLASQHHEKAFAIQQNEYWSNEYSETCGDIRALGLSCNDLGGSEAYFPSDWSLLKSATNHLNRRLNKVIVKEINH